MGEATIWLISIVAAIVPTVIYVNLLWWLDHYEKEPRRLLLAAFVWGALPAAVISILAEQALAPQPGVMSTGTVELVTGSVLAPFVEELAKGIALFLLFTLSHSEFDDVLDGIIYGATVGFGFAMSENALYFVRSAHTGGLRTLTFTVLLRAILFGMNHALFTSVFGASLGYVQTLKRGLRRWTLPLLGLLGGMLLHAVHNLFASLSRVLCLSLAVSVLSDWSGVVVIIVVVLLAWRQEQGWIVTYLHPEAESGLLTPDEYQMLSSYSQRMAGWWRARRVSGDAAKRFTQFTQTATELAFKLRQGDTARAQKLREKLVTLRSA